jgi:hypothetical protein
MYSNSPIKKYFFAVLSLWIIFLGVFIYFFYSEGKGVAGIGKILAVSSLSFMLNISTILGSKFKKKRKIWALIIYGVLFISSLKEFLNLDIGIAYFLLSIAFLLILDVLPVSSSLKYFNVGILITVSSFLYFPIVFLVILFLFVTVLYYKEKVNISQYLAGVLVTIILALEVAYLTDGMSYIVNWINTLGIPEFHFEYQIPILIILLIIFVYGWINQYSNNKVTEDIEISSKHFILVFYLFFWIIIYAFFMGDNYELLVFVSLPASMITSRGM